MWFDPAAAPGWHDWAGLVLAVVGFVIAMIQLHKVRSASDAAALELGKAREKLNTDQLSATVNALQLIGSDLDFAIDNNDREVAHRALLRFSYVAKESVALLANLPANHSLLQSRLTEAAEAALDTKGAIVGRQVVDIAKKAKAITATIATLTVEISGLVAQDRYQLGRTEHAV